jgi:hypothetical protein
LEKNAVSEPKTLQRAISSTAVFLKSPTFLADFQTNHRRRNGAVVLVAEGEELGSNLLRVAQSSLVGPGVSGSLRAVGSRLQQA